MARNLPGKNFKISDHLFLSNPLYQSAVNSIKHNFRLDIFQTGKFVAEDDKTWEELSKKVKEGMEKGETAIIVTVLEKKP